MVEISKSGSGEGLGWVTGRGYSTVTGPRQIDLGWVRVLNGNEKADPHKTAALPKSDLQEVRLLFARGSFVMSAPSVRSSTTQGGVPCLGG